MEVELLQAAIKRALTEEEINAVNITEDLYSSLEE